MSVCCSKRREYYRGMTEEEKVKWLDEIAQQREEQERLKEFEAECVLVLLSHLSLQPSIAALLSCVPCHLFSNHPSLSSFWV